MARKSSFRCESIFVNEIGVCTCCIDLITIYIASIQKPISNNFIVIGSLLFCTIQYVYKRYHHRGHARPCTVSSKFLLDMFDVEKKPTIGFVELLAIANS